MNTLLGWVLPFDALISNVLLHAGTVFVSLVLLGSLRTWLESSGSRSSVTVTRVGKRQNFSSPSLILDDEGRGKLYLSGILQLGEAVDETVLFDHGISAVVDMIPDSVNEPPYRKSNPYSNVIAYLNLPLYDSYTEKITPYLQESLHFIERMRARGRSVLVHCAAGVSRSTTVVIYYIMNTYKMKPMDAFLMVRERRPVVRPNTGFMRELVLSSITDPVEVEREYARYLVNCFPHLEEAGVKEDRLALALLETNGNSQEAILKALQELSNLTDTQEQDVVRDDEDDGSSNSRCKINS